MNRENSTECSIQDQNEILTQLRIESQEQCQKYKDEHKITSDLFESSNKKYFSIINTLKDNEEKRIYFISFHLEKYISFLEEENTSLNSALTSMGKGQNTNTNKMMAFKVKLEDDMKIYLDKFNFIYKPNERFINENFLLYDIYRRNIESIINNSNNLIQKGRDLDLYETPTSTNGVNIYPMSSNDYNQNAFNFNSEINIVLENNDLIIYNSLFTEKPFNINKKLFSDFLKKLNNDISFCEKIIDKSLGEYFYNQLYHEFKTKEQFDKMAQILIAISNNREVQSKVIEMNLPIIYISEKGFYYDKND